MAGRAAIHVLSGIVMGFLVSVVLLACPAASTRSPSVSHTPRAAPTHVPPGWRRIRRAPARAPVRVTVAITQPGAEDVKRMCQAVSEPTSDLYGTYLTQAQLTTLLNAGGNHAVVLSWLRSAGATDVRSGTNLDYVTATLTAAAVEAALHVDMHVFVHDQAGAILRATTLPSGLPPAVRDAVDLVLGVSDFPLATTAASSTITNAAVRRPGKYERATQAGIASFRHAFARASTRTNAAPDAPATPSSSVPPPSVVYDATSPTSFQLFATQVCPSTSQLANTSVPCSDTTLPISTYQIKCAFNGWVVTDVAWKDVDMQCETGAAGRICTYIITAPHTYSAFDFANCSLRARAGGVASEWASLPWMNVPARDQKFLLTPQVTPDYMNRFYGLGPDTRVKAATQAVAEFDRNHYIPSDLTSFLDKYKVNMTGALILHGKNNPADFGAEATLDIEWIIAAAPSADTTFWYQEGVNGTRKNSFVLGMALAVANATSPPLVFSVSFIGPEEFFNKLAGPTYIPRTNIEFAKMCTRGITVVAASGDAGAANDGHGIGTCAIKPLFPASSPWVTAVSATFMDPNGDPRPNPGAAGLGESAVSVPGGMGWTTGGGFSTEETCRQPWYQHAAVAQYLTTALASDLPPPSLFNSSNRAYPDISALGHNIMTITDGFVSAADGTSAATPIIAGMATRLNQARMSQGLPSVGFLNPLLYAAARDVPAAFYDVTTAANNRCGGFACCPYGYEVTKGWDAVTGLGTIGDFGALRDYAIQSALLSARGAHSATVARAV